MLHYFPIEMQDISFYLNGKLEFDPNDENIYARFTWNDYSNTIVNISQNHTYFLTPKFSFLVFNNYAEELNCLELNRFLIGDVMSIKPEQCNKTFNYACIKPIGKSLNLTAMFMDIAFY